MTWNGEASARLPASARPAPLRVRREAEAGRVPLQRRRRQGADPNRSSGGATGAVTGGPAVVAGREAFWFNRGATPDRTLEGQHGRPAARALRVGLESTTPDPKAAEAFDSKVVGWTTEAFPGSGLLHHLERRRPGDRRHDGHDRRNEGGRSAATLDGLRWRDGRRGGGRQGRSRSAAAWRWRRSRSLVSARSRSSPICRVSVRRPAAGWAEPLMALRRIPPLVEISWRELATSDLEGASLRYGLVRVGDAEAQRHGTAGDLDEEFGPFGRPSPACTRSPRTCQPRRTGRCTHACPTCKRRSRPSRTARPGAPWAAGGPGRQPDRAILDPQGAAFALHQTTS